MGLSRAWTRWRLVRFCEEVLLGTPESDQKRVFVNKTSKFMCVCDI
jgi:hypothetical protein